MFQFICVSGPLCYVIEWTGLNFDVFPCFSANSLLCVIIRIESRYCTPAIITCFWTLTIHTDKIFWKNLLKNKKMYFKNGSPLGLWVCYLQRLDEPLSKYAMGLFQSSIYSSVQRGEGFFRKSPFCNFSCIDPGFGGPWDML